MIKWDLLLVNQQVSCCQVLHNGICTPRDCHHFVDFQFLIRMSWTDCHISGNSLVQELQPRQVFELQHNLCESISPALFAVAFRATLHCHCSLAEMEIGVPVCLLSLDAHV